MASAQELLSNAASNGFFGLNKILLLRVTAQVLNSSISPAINRWRSMYNSIKAGNPGQLILSFAGDSNTSLGRVTKPLASEFSSLGDAGPGYINALRSILADGTCATIDGIAISATGTWAGNSHNGAGMLELFSGDIGTPATLTVTSKVNSFVLHYWTQPGGGKFSWALDGGPATTVDTNAPVNFGSIIIGGSLDAGSDHTIVITMTEASSQGVWVLGVDCRKSSTGFRLHNLGFGGSEVEDWISHPELAPNGGTSVEIFGGAQAALVPNLVTLMFGVNAKIRNITPSTYQQNMEVLVNRIKTGYPNTDIAVIGAADTGGSGTYPMSDYAAAGKSAAVATSVAYLPLYEQWGPFADADAKGYYANPTHFNDLGGQVAAGIIASFLK